MPPTPAPLPQFDQTLIGLGIYIPLSPSSPSSSATTGSSQSHLLSPPPFLTPQSQTRRSGSRSPRTLGTRNGFRLSPAGSSLPRSIYSGEENPFLPSSPTERDMGTKQDEGKGEGEYEGGDVGPEERVRHHSDKTGREREEMRRREKSKEFDDILLDTDFDLDDDDLPESTFPKSNVNTPQVRSRVGGGYRSFPRRHLGMGGDGTMESGGGYEGPGPIAPSPNKVDIPSTPRPATTDSNSVLLPNPFTPSTPYDNPTSTSSALVSALASPHPTPSAPTRSMGHIASALAEDVAPVPNPLFAASIALSVILGVLIVGIVSCSVAYCRRGKNVDGSIRGGKDEENDAGGAGGNGSPKRHSLAGLYPRGVGTKTPDSQRAFDKFSTQSSVASSATTLVGSRRDSRPPSILKAPLGYSPEQAGKVAFLESPTQGGESILVGIMQVHRQLYTPPVWQNPTSPTRSSPLAQSAYIATSSPDFPPETRSKTPISRPSSRLSICAISPLSAISDDPTSPSTRPSSMAESSHSCSASIHTTASTHNLSADMASNDGHSYNSCSDNSSMTTHASDDAFGYTSRPSSLADSLFGAGASVSDLTTARRASTASSVSFAPSVEYPMYPNYPADDDDLPDDSDVSFDTLSSISVQTPRGTPEPESKSALGYLGSPLGDEGKRSARSRRVSVGGTPSPVLRTRFAVEDDTSSIEEEESEEEEAEIGIQAKVVAGTTSGGGSRGFMSGSRKIIFLESEIGNGVGTINPTDIKRSLSLPSKTSRPEISIQTPNSNTATPPPTGVLKRALSVLRGNAETSPTQSHLQYGPPTPPRLGRKLSLASTGSNRPISVYSPKSVITHESDIDPAYQTNYTSSLFSPPSIQYPQSAQSSSSSPTSTQPSSPISSPSPLGAIGTNEEEESAEGIARFSTASWDQLELPSSISSSTSPIDMSYLLTSTSESSSTIISTTSTSSSSEGNGSSSLSSTSDDDEMWAEINLARISFGILSNNHDLTINSSRFSSESGILGTAGFGMLELEAFPQPASHLPQFMITSH